MELFDVNDLYTHKTIKKRLKLKENELEINKKYLFAYSFDHTDSSYEIECVR